MNRLFVFVVLVCFVFPVFAQDDQTPPAIVDRFEVSVLANVSVFYLDGNYKVFESPMAFGIVYIGKKYPVQTGLYLSPTITKDGDLTDVKLGVIWHNQLFRTLGAGIGYNFWDDGIGLVNAKKSTVFLTVSINISGNK